jgi:uncharacterized damage-inducible protein DinB
MDRSFGTGASAPDTIGALFLTTTRYYLNVEYRTKLRHAVMSLPADRVWWRPNETANSVGNLLVHLTGNLSQWILHGIGDRPYERHRAEEFAARSGEAAAELLAALEHVLDQVDQVLGEVTEARLLEPANIQGRGMTVLEAIFHVTEHFSTHLGQIVMMAKHMAPGAVRFYEDAGGMATPVWKDLIPPARGDERR